MTIGLYDYKVVFMVGIPKKLVHSMAISDSLLMALVITQCKRAVMVNAAKSAQDQ